MWGARSAREERATPAQRRRGTVPHGVVLVLIEHGARKSLEHTDPRAVLLKARSQPVQLGQQPRKLGSRSRAAPGVGRRGPGNCHRSAAHCRLVFRSAIRVGPVWAQSPSGVERGGQQGRHGAPHSHSIVGQKRHQRGAVAGGSPLRSFSGTKRCAPTHVVAHERDSLRPHAAG